MLAAIPASIASLLPVQRRLDAVESADQGAEHKRQLVRLAILAVFVGVGLYYAAPRQKSFFVEAVTDIVSVRTEYNPDILWEVANLTICRPVDVATDASPSASPSICAAPFYTQDTLEFAEIEWPGDLALEIRMQPERDLEILVQLPSTTQRFFIEDIEIVNETLLVVPVDTFSEFGILMITGEVMLGQVATHGTRHLLRQGRYEVREQLGLRNRPVLVASGGLTLGDSVTIASVEEGEPLISNVFFDRADGSRQTLRAVATSPLAESQLLVRRAGSRTAVIRSNWVQRVTNDPLPAGIATLLSLLGASLAIAVSFIRSR